jgi:CheY-like chemotaxis protein
MSVTAAQLSILVVDDDPLIAEILAEVLNDMGHQADVAVGGLTGLARLHEKSYHVVFADMKMPDLNGVQLYRAAEAAAKEKRPPFVFVTGNVFAPEVSAFLATSGQVHVEKPFRPEDIAHALESVFH